ncbi:MAG: hypothetical protein LKI65_09405 [Prevotella sp.]|nr:hypothetical protein [Prevotella sp.]
METGKQRLVTVEELVNVLKDKA